MNHIIRHRTPDTGWAWVISLSIGAINGLTFGLVRSFGVFFFYLRREFEVSRQVASWPFALCTSCTYLTGPITGLLISYFHLRTIVCVGILFTSAGFASCFWVTDINQIVLLVGVVHGKCLLLNNLYKFLKFSMFQLFFVKFIATVCLA